jgi:hypothetical protein
MLGIWRQNYWGKRIFPRLVAEKIKISTAFLEKFHFTHMSVSAHAM